MPEEKEQKFTVVFRRASDYKIYPAQIIYGGPVPDGSGILMSLCVDHTAFPSYVQHPVDKEGRVDPLTITDQVTTGHVEREMLAGIYLTVEQAERLAVWLTNHIKQMKGGNR